VLPTTDHLSLFYAFPYLGALNVSGKVCINGCVLTAVLYEDSLSIPAFGADEGNFTIP